MLLIGIIETYEAGVETKNVKRRVVLVSEKPVLYSLNLISEQKHFQ